MQNNYVSPRTSLSMDGLIKALRSCFDQISDHRASNSFYSLSDVLMSGFAMFSLKHPSLLDFEQQSVCDRKNLRSVFGIHRLCTDAQMRNVLDEVNPEALWGVFSQQDEVLERLGIVEEFKFWQDRVVMSIDAVEHFRSSKIHCDRCQKKTGRDGHPSYSHSMLCAVMVHPDKREVFVSAAEPMLKQDRYSKDDSEQGACTRLFDRLKNRHRFHKMIIVQDALFANAPHIRKILDHNWHYILSVKPARHKKLFADFAAKKKIGKTHEIHFKRAGTNHRFSFANKLSLSKVGADIKVNFLDYEQIDSKGKKRRFSWITSIPISKRNVEKIMRAGRARWKIENETFNTLKNQGYHFEHNYGHGKKNLATVLAQLMLLAFLLDQIFQICSPLFRSIWKETKTKKKLFRGLRSLFHVTFVDSFHELYIQLANLYQIQLE